MNPFLKQSRWWPLVAVAFYLGTVTLLAQAPTWWSTRGVLLSGPGIVTNDFSPANQGQVKWLATQAKAEFDEKLAAVGGAGLAINTLVAGFSSNNNYRPVNAGMLKNTVQPFYDRLYELGLTNCYPLGAGTPYPWSGSTNPTRDFSLVNAGQVKYAFGFAPFTVVPPPVVEDSDGNGLPDTWEQQYFGHLGVDPHADPDGDGLTNLGEVQYGTNPLLADANPNWDPNGDGLTIAERAELGIPPSQHVNVVVLGEANIAFDIKVVETYRNKSIGIKDYVSQTNGCTTPTYYLRETEQEVLNDAGGVISSSGPHGFTFTHTLNWCHNYEQQFSLMDGFYSGSWDFSWHYDENTMWNWGDECGCNESTVGSAQWTSNAICTGGINSSYRDWFNWSMLSTNFTSAEAWVAANHASYSTPDYLPHLTTCCSNGGAAVYHQDIRPYNIFMASLLYTELQRTSNALLYTIQHSGYSQCMAGLDTRTLSQEFTTHLLEQTGANDLARDEPFNSLVWGETWDYDQYGMRHCYTNATGSPMSFRHLFDDEMSFSAGKALYRVVVNTNQFSLETGTVYRVNIAHIFTPDTTNSTSTNILLQTYPLLAQYTGGSQLFLMPRVPCSMCPPAMVW